MTGALRGRVARAAFLAALLQVPDAHAADEWLGKDKFLHFGVSAVLAGTGYAIGTTVFEARGHALLLGGGVASAAGIGKELLDLTGYGDPSWRDLAADAVGIVVGLAVAYGLDVLVRGVSEAHPALGAPRPSQPVSRATSWGGGALGPALFHFQ